MSFRDIPELSDHLTLPTLHFFMRSNSSFHAGQKGIHVMVIECRISLIDDTTLKKSVVYRLL